MNNNKYNFSAGPAMLPDFVMQQVKEQWLDWSDGLSIVEMSHRDPKVLEMFEKTSQNFKELLSIPDSHEVLFLQGGARAQFAMVPLNLLKKPQAICHYVITGHWSQLAQQEAKRYGTAQILYSTEKTNFTTIPINLSWETKETAYIHYVDNETIQGVEFHEHPKTRHSLVADMSSNILSKPIDISKYAVIYASAQKNISIAGLTIVIVNKELLAEPLEYTSQVHRYSTWINSRSMYNTPPVFACYICSLVLDWLKKIGGVEAQQKLNQKKANLLYGYIDKTDFYNNKVADNCRSIMNIPFNLTNAALEKEFFKEAKLANLYNLRGHPIVGGARASIYNAMPESGVLKLIDFMEEFANKNI